MEATASRYINGQEFVPQELVKKLESKLGGQLQRLHPVGNDKVGFFENNTLKGRVRSDWII